MFNLNINIVINSNRDIFIFQLGDDREIIYSVFDSSLIALNSNSLYDKNILNYSVLIDENDIIHLVALISNGELNYYKYIEGKWSKSTIAKFDIKSNIYNQIEILMIKDKLHIIYDYSNLINSNVWTIQHVIYGTEEKHNAIRYVSKRTPDPFIIDVDKQGTIHLLYRNNINNPQIYHVFYSHYTKTWSSLSKQISSDSSNNWLPFLFIDSQDNLHGLWIEEVNNNYQMKYLRMNSSGKEKYIWKDIKLPYIPLSKYPPIIFEENNKLKLISLYNNNIDLLYSSDYGNSWLKEENSEILRQNTILAKVRSNIDKINYIYCNIFDNLKFYFLDSFSYIESPKTFETSSLESENKEIISEPSEIKPDILNGLENKIESILENYDFIHPILNQLLTNQKSMEDKLDNLQKSINSKKSSFLNRFIN